ncbi:CHY zinc finger protein [Mycetocola spongiae]|uniref:CHY zinc finger protein n=1 Tax=Mycetocola spongiae TaxID=2859226 RepID=UPI001CF45F5B|nr:CHY zinc finger protein [Mycetocola spongiae]UCR89079.1 hypothetical protein KXZ72_14260 [Mycetocola spongiae]
MTLGRVSVQVFGATVDEHTRCVHYGSERDIVAIRFYCCGRFYPCHLCHEEDADHLPQRWPRERWDEPAILCGQCSQTLPINTYLVVERCPHCRSEFNPGCALHAPLYFDTADTAHAGIADPVRASA